jgi:hypothetical protein
MTIKFIGSICHAATTNTTLLPPPPSRCPSTSKRAAATAKIVLLPSCHLHRQAVHRHRAAAATTSATTLPLPCYHCLQNKIIIILLRNLFFTTMVMAARSNEDRNQSPCIEKGKPKNNNKIRQHEKPNPSFNSPCPFSLSNTFLLK